MLFLFGATLVGFTQLVLLFSSFLNNQSFALAGVSSPVSFAICLIAKNENDDILEWLKYHESIGVKSIILFDDNSTVPMYSIVKPYIDSGMIVNYTFLSNQPTSKKNQFYVYRYCIDHYKDKYTHIGMFDSDEFLNIKNENLTVTDLLTPYKDYGGLALNWMLFNSNGHILRPSGGVLSNYAMCYAHSHIKTIVNTKYVIDSVTPHHFSYQPGYYAVDTNFQRVDGFFSNRNNNNSSKPLHKRTPADDPLYQIAYINHYNLKSLEDFNRKVHRGYPDGARPRTYDYFLNVHKVPQFNCGILKIRSKEL